MAARSSALSDGVHAVSISGKVSLRGWVRDHDHENAERPVGERSESELLGSDQHWRTSLLFVFLVCLFVSCCCFSIILSFFFIVA